MLHSNPQQCEFTIKKVDNNYIYLLIHHPHPAIKQITFLAAQIPQRFDKSKYFPLIISLNENTEDQIDLYSKQLLVNINKLLTQYDSIGFAVHDTEIKEGDISQFVRVSEKILENSKKNKMAFPATKSIVETRGHIKIIGIPDAVIPLVLKACYPDSLTSFRKQITTLREGMGSRGSLVSRELWKSREDTEKELLEELKGSLIPQMNALFKSYPPPAPPQKKPKAVGTSKRVIPNTVSNNSIITPQCNFTVKRVDNNYIYLHIHDPHPAIKKITFAAARGMPRFDKTQHFSLIISFNENTGDQIDRFKAQLQLNIQKKQDEVKDSGVPGQEQDVDTDIELAVHDTEIKEDNTSEFVKVSDEIVKNSLNSQIKIIPTTKSIMQTGGHIKIMGQPEVVIPAGLAACFPSISDFGSEIIELLGKIGRKYVRGRAMWSTYDNKNKKDSRLDVLQDQLRLDLNRLFKSYSPSLTSQKKPQAAGANQPPDNSNNNPIITPQTPQKQLQAPSASQQATPNTVNNKGPIITPHQSQGKVQDKNTPSGNAVESRLRKHKLARFIDRLGFLKEIEALIADKTKQDIPNNVSFCEALEALVDDLNKDLLRQENALEMQAQKIGKNPDYSTLEQTTAGKIATNTLAMLQALKKETAPAAKLDIIRRYENDCKATPGWLKFAKGLAMVCFAAVGFVMGAAIGMGIGIAVGAWSGPGAFVTAALGAVQGAAIGVMAAASLVGLGAAIVSGLVLFKAQPSVSKATELARVSENLLLPTI